MCKLIRTKSGVLRLALETEYLNEVADRERGEAEEEKDDRRLRVQMLEAH